VAFDFTDDPYRKGDAKKLLKKQMRELAAKNAKAKRERAREVAARAGDVDFYCLECKNQGKRGKGCGTCGAKPE
jgi:hypothetical protein